MTDQKREKAGWGNLGMQRHLRYVHAFDRVIHCVDAKYYLEAIAILDSLITDRLASRLGYLVDEEISARLTSGQLCGRLVGKQDDQGVEKDSGFRAIVQEIQQWVLNRNDAMHAAAKILRSDEAPTNFSDLLESHHQNALTGIRLLQSFDQLDTADRRARGKLPATQPDAFFPEKRRIAGSRRKSASE